MELGLCPVFFLKKILGLKVVFSLKRGSEIRPCASIDSCSFLSKIVVNLKKVSNEFMHTKVLDQAK
jgi:hypothetical protein